MDVNQRYLQQDYFTDIITFDYCEGDKLSGDLFISVDTVRENAIEYGTEFKDELNRVIVHGILHLIGYDDHNKKDIEVMRKKENYYLPTEYVFVFVEKQPLLYAHIRLPDGPRWLAKQEYQYTIGGDVSQSPDVLHSEISEEYANSSTVVPIAHSSYANPTMRTIINSQLYQWAERFQELYPYHLTTVYEDDAFVCYMFRQNPARLLDLAIID